MKHIQAILVGCGMVGCGIVKEAGHRGVDFIGAFDVAPPLIGRDLGDAAGAPPPHTVIRRAEELDRFLETHPADIGIVTVTAPFELAALDATRTLLRHGVNVLTSLADVYVMERDRPEWFRELDALAKEHGVTFFSSGIQDVFWTALPVALSGCSLEIREIRGRNVALIDSFGPGVADECYVGWDLERFQRASAAGELPANDFLIALYELAKKLSLHPTGEHSTLKPLLAKSDTYYEGIDRRVKAGQLLGNYVESVVETEEGVTLCCEFVSKMSEEGDTDLNRWEITGRPNINVITQRMQGDITTGSNMINRIPDVINAPAGVISASEMPVPCFKVRDLHTYIAG